MERVQYQQEEMLAELKDLIQKGLFTVNETKQILKKRTMYETALIRKAARKADFLRYAAYEMRLEQLRRKRVERLNVSTTPPTISDYAIVKRQFNIYERALKRFKSDVGLWMQYISIAKREGARVLVGRITARALQLHANTPAFYIIAASQELKNLSPSAARTLLQRGIRLNPDSIDLWREHVRLELGFIETLRKRWEVLGVDMDVSPESAEADDILDITPAEEDGVDLSGAVARKQIMNGVIVKSVITSACEAIPKIELFVSLRDVIDAHPAPPALRLEVLNHLYGLVPATLPSDPRGIKFLATRHLTSNIEGESLVDALQQANRILMDNVKVHNRNEEILQVYAEFIEDWIEKESVDDALKDYLLASLVSMLKHSKSSPALLSAHIRLMIQHPSTTSTPSQTLSIAQKYTRRAPASAHVWLGRLNAELALGSDRKAIDEAWSAARKSVQGKQREEVWLWGIENSSDEDPDRRQQAHETVLLESMRDPLLSHVHEKILMSYIRLIYSNALPWSKRRDVIRRISTTYLPTSRTWQLSFKSEASEQSDTEQEQEEILKQIYELWMKATSSSFGENEDAKVEATLAWASWLIKRERGKEAKDVVMRTRGMLDERGKATLESRWAQFLDAGAGEGDEDEDAGDVELQEDFDEMQE